MYAQRVILKAVAALMLLSAFACSSSTPPMSAAMTPPKNAVIISGGNAGSTVIYLPTGDAENPTMMSTSGTVDECPDCRAAAIKYFKTGVLDPHCSRCGANRTVANYVTTPSVSHN